MSPKEALYEEERKRILVESLKAASNELRLKILSLLYENEGQSYSELLQKTKVPSGQLANSLRELSKTPLIDRYYDSKDTGCYSFYRLTQFGEHFMSAFYNINKGSVRDGRSLFNFDRGSTFSPTGSTTLGSYSLAGTSSMIDLTVNVVTVSNNGTALYTTAATFLTNSSTINFVGNGGTHGILTVNACQTYTYKSKSTSQEEKDIDSIALSSKDGGEEAA